MNYTLLFEQKDLVLESYRETQVSISENQKHLEIKRPNYWNTYRIVVKANRVELQNGAVLHDFKGTPENVSSHFSRVYGLNKENQSILTKTLKELIKQVKYTTVLEQDSIQICISENHNFLLYKNCGFRIAYTINHLRQVISLTNETITENFLGTPQGVSTRFARVFGLTEENQEVLHQTLVSLLDGNK